jgi:hypothetical protein
MEQSHKRHLFRDPLILVLIGLVVLAIVPIPFLAYRLLQGTGGLGSLVVAMPTATPTAIPTPTSTPTATPTPTSTPTPVPTPTPVLSPFTGLPVDPASLQRPILAVMIPSDSEQHGMSQASIVFEASAEYSIQRFMAVFEQVDTDKLGPIRSARLYYVDWACGYHAVYTHWGGSPQAYDRLYNTDCVYNLDGINEEFPFWRAEVVDIPWNNGFTDSSSVYSYLEEHNVTRTVQPRGFLHKDDALPETRPLTGTISISGVFRFSVYYEFAPQENIYLRFYKGRPHVDMNTGEQHRARNVVVMFVPEAPIPDDPKGRLEIQTTGEGEALFFLDGTMVHGRWAKEAPEAELRFFDDAAREVAFNRGNIWIEVLAVGQEGDLSYAIGRPR